MKKGIRLGMPFEKWMTQVVYPKNFVAIVQAL